MKKLIDLSHTIEDYLPVYPGDEETRLYQSRKLKEDKYNNHRLEISMHTGTHIDSPMHLTESETYISEIPLDRFIGKGCVIDVRGQNEIELKEEYKELIGEGSIVLLYTGQAEKFGTDEYFTDYPILSEEFGEFLVEKKIKILGLDSPSPDRYPFAVHKMLFGGDVLIVENLKDLDKLTKLEEFEVMAFPLKVKADGAVLRVVAREM